MNAAVKYLDRLEDPATAQANHAYVRELEGDTVDDVIAGAHPAVAAELVWDSYADQVYTDEAVLVEEDHYYDVLGRLHRAETRRETGTVNPHMQTIIDRQFTKGVNDFYTKYRDYDSFDELASDFPVIDRELSSLLGRFGGWQGIGLAGGVAAMQHGNPGIGMGALLGGMTLSLVDVMRKNAYWQGVRAGYAAEDAADAVPALNDIGDREVVIDSRFNFRREYLTPYREAQYDPIVSDEAMEALVEIGELFAEIDADLEASEHSDPD